MCTVSWLHSDGDGYRLFCNRDEKRTRLPAAAPRIAVRDGVQFIAPADGDSGGTWILATEAGLTLCLLNGANLSDTDADTQPSPIHARPLRSRGLLLLDLAAAPSASHAMERISNMNLAPYPPFTMVALQPGSPAAAAEWTGAHATLLHDADARMPLLSSSFDTQTVRATRQHEFDGMIRQAGSVDAATLLRFHRSHAPERSAYSTCMHRPDASTVSFSQVTVTPETVEFSYSPGAPCEAQPAQTIRLRRTAA